MGADTLFQDLKNELTTFKGFLSDDNIAIIKPAIQKLKLAVPPIGDLLKQLIALMGQIQTAVTNLNVNAIPGLDKVSDFTTAVTSLLQAAENLLPEQKSNIDQVLSVANLVSSLPSLDQIKDEILKLIKEIIDALTNLNS